MAGGSKKRRKEFCRPSPRGLLALPGAGLGDKQRAVEQRALFQARAGRSSSQRPAPLGSASSSVSRRGTLLEHPLPGASTVAAPGPSPGSGKSFKNTFQSLKATVSILTEQNSSRFWRSVSYPAENRSLRGFEEKNYRERNYFQIRSLGHPDCLAPPTLSSPFPEGTGRGRLLFPGNVFTPNVLLSPRSHSETLTFKRGFPMGSWEGHTALLILKKSQQGQQRKDAEGPGGAPEAAQPCPGPGPSPR